MTNKLQKLLSDTQITHNSQIQETSYDPNFTHITQPSPQEKTIAHLAYDALQETKAAIYGKEENKRSPNPEKNSFSFKAADGKQISYTETADVHNYDAAALRDKGWMGSGDWRSAFAAKELGMSFDNLDSMPNVRVNARTHKLEFEIDGRKDTLNIDRGGALTDFRAGDTNIRDLQNAKKIEEENLQKIDKGMREALKGLENNYDEILNETPSKIKAYLSKVPSDQRDAQREILTKHLSLKLFTPYYENEAIEKALDGEAELSLEDIEFDLKGDYQQARLMNHASKVKLDVVEKHVQLALQSTKFQERQERLDEQMLQRLTSAFYADRPQGGKYLLCQMSLLDETIDKNKNGFAHNEKNFMLDSAYTYERFNGATIHFSSEAEKPSFVEGDKGKIAQVIIPWPKEKNPIPQDTTLTSIFFNQSVQGETDNNKLVEQKRINEDAIRHLEKFTPDDKKATLTGLKNRLNDTNSSYELARDILLFAKSLGGSIGVNCFSGKDRTGELITQVIKKHITDRAAESGIKLSRAETQKIAKNLHSDKGIARQVAFLNVGVAALKIKKIFIDGMSVASRIHMALQARKAAA